jgi:hypothetical protein
MKERDIQDAIRLALAQLGATMFRQNTGLGWTGEVFRVPAFRMVAMNARDVLIRNARPLHAGLHKGSSDLCGWYPVTITPEMVGRRVAVFSGVEVKSERGRVSDDQEIFLGRLREDGGISVVARSVDDAIRGISDWNSNNNNGTL